MQNTPEIMAAKILDQYWDDNYFPVDPYKIATKMGITVMEAKLPEEISGLYHSENGKREIYISGSENLNRKRFTAAHELGHAVDIPNASFVDKPRDRISQQGTDKEEVFDDQFAAALLIPGYAVHKLIRHGWDVPQMADFFGVSNSAMSIRVIFSPPLREGLLFKTIDTQPRIVAPGLNIAGTEVFFLHQRKRRTEQPTYIFSRSV